MKRIRVAFADLSLRKELSSAVIIFLLGATVQTALLCLECFMDNRLWPYTTFSGFMWLFFWKGSEYQVILLDQWIRWLDAPLKRLLIGVTMMITYITFIFVGLYMIYSVLFWSNSIRDSWNALSWDDLAAPLVVSLAINMFMHGRGFLLSWREEAIRAERLKTEQVATQYNSLKSQVNPHFLFNSLNALSSLVMEDQEKAVQFIRKLSDVYRYVLDQRNVEVVSLEEELSFIQSYIFLQKIRYNGSLIVKNRMENLDPTLVVLPLSIQILLENAIKHNVISEADPLTIEMELDEANEFICIQNSKMLRTTTESHGIGLQSLQERYAHFSDRSVEIINDDSFFLVKLPYLRMS